MRLLMTTVPQHHVQRIVIHHFHQSLAGPPGLLGGNLGLHLPPRLENHLVPSLLQQGLPLLAVGAPPFPGHLAGAGFDPAAAAAFRLASGRRVKFVLQVVPRNQIRMGRAGSGRLVLRCRNVGTRVTAARRRRGLERDGRLCHITNTLACKFQDQ